MQVTRTGSNQVTVRYRDPVSLERKQTVIKQRPYAFVEDHNAEFVECVEQQTGYTGLYGESLTKCIFNHTGEVYDLRQRGFKTWEANVDFNNRCLVDSGLHFPYYRHRVWYLDAEWIEAKDDEICVLSIYDNYMEKMLTWYVDHTKTHTGFIPVRDFHFKKDPDGRKSETYPTPAKCFSNETEMLNDFIKTLKSKDPDVIAGWWLLQADINTLFKRLDKCGLDAKSLSPYGRIDRKKLGDYDQPIDGIICVDLMKNFTRLWTVKNGQLPGQSLDDISRFCLGEKKVTLPDGHDTYYTDLDLYVDYNRQDVWLLPKLDKMLNCIDHFISLQHIVQCDFFSTPYVTRLTTVMILRDEKFDRRIPTDAQFDKVDYEGADIQDVVEGVYDTVAILDVKAMYHSNVSLHNISWETLQPDGTFTKGEPGLLCRMMDRLTDLRNEYKAKMKEATSSDEKKTWDAAQYATKSLVASLYGVCGDSRYGMYHPEIAAAITRESRRTLGNLRQACEKRGYPVIYGHTDSVFVTVPSPEEGVALMGELNEELAPIVTEFEKWTERIFLKAKNRYAGKVMWTDGVHHEPDYYVKGLELIQARMPEAMKTVMMETLTTMLDGATEGALNEKLSDYIHDMVEGRIPCADLAIRGRLKRDLNQYKSISGVAAGAAWANENLGKKYRKGDYYWCLLDEDGRYIGGDTVEEIEQNAAIGYRHFVERFVLEKVQPLYEIAGFNISPLYDAMNGRAPVEWL